MTNPCGNVTLGPHARSAEYPASHTANNAQRIATRRGNIVERMDASAMSAATTAIIRHAHTVKLTCAAITRFSGVTATPVKAAHARRTKAPAMRANARAAGTAA